MRLSARELKVKLGNFAHKAKLSGDHAINPHIDFAPKRRQAAVLVPIIDHPAEQTVLLTKRSPYLPVHAGQVSFPGGSREKADTTLTETALRETHEEVGITAENVTVIGSLSTYNTGTGFAVTPVVGLIKPTYDLSLEEGEVAEVFEVPISFLMRRDAFQKKSRLFGSVQAQFYEATWQNYVIWGATAGMLVNFQKVFLGDCLV